MCRRCRPYPYAFHAQPGAAALDPLALHERRDEGDERRSALADHAPPQPAVGNEQYDAARSHEGAAVDNERSTDALIPGVLRNEPSGGTRREEQVVKPLVERPEAYPSRRFRPAEQKWSAHSAGGTGSSRAQTPPRGRAPRRSRSAESRGSWRASMA